MVGWSRAGPLLPAPTARVGVRAGVGVRVGVGGEVGEEVLVRQAVPAVVGEAVSPDLLTGPRVTALTGQGHGGVETGQQRRGVLRGQQCQ